MVGAPTPNIDELAAEGLKLTSAYASPLCTPTRAALMTGRLPARSGLTRPLLASDHPTKNPWADEVSAAKLLSENGYVTGLAGKWHIGEGEGMQPQQVGYDEFHGFLSVVSEYTQYMDERKYSQLMLDPERLATFKGLSEYNAVVNGKKGGELSIAYPLDTAEEMANVDQDFANWSVDFIKRAAEAKKPFYLIHAFAKVHFDNFSPEEYKGKSPAKLPYRDAVVEVDDIVGRLIATLKETGEAREHAGLLHLRQRPGGGQLSRFRLHAVPGRQGHDLGRWRPGAGHRKLAGDDRAGADQRRSLRPDGLFNTSLALAGIEDKIPTERYIDVSTRPRSC